jgi:hypothetical protein
VLDLTTNDYLLAGIDGLFVPIAVASLLALVCLWLNRLLLTRLPGDARRRAVRILVPVAAVAGAVLMTLAFLDLLTEGEVFGVNSPNGGLCLALGVILLAYAVRLIRLSLPPLAPVHGRRPAATGLAEWGAAFLLVSIGLFWAADGYAFGVGTGRAITLHRALPVVPEAVLYSSQSLSLDVPRGDRDALRRPGRRLPVPVHRAPPGAPGRQPVRAAAGELEPGVRDHRAHRPQRDHPARVPARGAAQSRLLNRFSFRTIRPPASGRESRPGSRVKRRGRTWPLDMTSRSWAPAARDACWQRG